MAAVKQRAVKEMGAKRAAGTSQADVGLKLLPAPGTGLVLNAEGDSQSIRGLQSFPPALGTVLLSKGRR